MKLHNTPQGFIKKTIWGGSSVTISPRGILGIDIYGNVKINLSDVDILVFGDSYIHTLINSNKIR